MVTTTQEKPKTVSVKKVGTILGPAFVAAIAYVDPGNVASNLTAGAEYGYLLVWVLVLANLMAALVQYLSAKVGYAAGASLPDLLGQRLPRIPRIAFWAQAEIVAIATDMAEVIGGAIALHILFGLPLIWGGVIVGIASILLLGLSRSRGRSFERVLIGFLLVVTLGFCAGLFTGGFDAGEMLAGILPRFQGSQSVLLAAAMLGATVMPHAIYLHSSLTRDVRMRENAPDPRSFVVAIRFDVGISLVVAGSVNIAMLVLAAAHLRGVEGTDTIEGAHHAIDGVLGPVIGTLFGVGLLASGLASTSVGSYAGGEIMAGLLHVRVPMLARRLVTLVPALAVLLLPVSPTSVLVISQVVLSFGIPFVIFPLVRYASSRAVMGPLVVHRATTIVAYAVATVITALNVLLIWLVATGQG